MDGSYATNKPVAKQSQNVPLVEQPCVWRKRLNLLDRRLLAVLPELLQPDADADVAGIHADVLLQPRVVVGQAVCGTDLGEKEHVKQCWRLEDGQWATLAVCHFDAAGRVPSIPPPIHGHDVALDERGRGRCVCPICEHLRNDVDAALHGERGSIVVPPPPAVARGGGVDSGETREPKDEKPG